MRKRKEQIFPAMCAVFLAALLTVLSVSDYFAACRQVQSDVLRLHILAHSDSEIDQAVKLTVRDRLLQKADLLFAGAASAEEAALELRPRLGEIAAAAEEVLRENGMDYGAEAQLVSAYFDTRAYDGFTLPAGTYTALRIVLGSGQGQNWWCVMFPPLCLPAAKADPDAAEAVFSGDRWQVVSPQGGYQVRFRLAELYAELRERISNRKKEK